MKIFVAKANQLGDNLVFLPVVQELLKQSRPEDLHLLTSPIASELYRGLIPRENLWTMPTKQVLGAWKQPWRFAGMLRRCRAIGPDAVLLPFDQGNVPRLLARLSGSPLRVGAENPSVLTDACLTHRLRFEGRVPVAAAEWNLGRLFAKVAGIDSGFAQVRPPPPDLSHLTGPVKRDLRTILIHPDASLPCKRWPADRFVALANRLSEHYRVLWAESDSVSRENLSPSVQRLPRGRLTDFVRTLAGCGLFIGNHSGPMNLAVATDVPSVIFAGPSPKRWDPIWNADRNLILRTPSLDCQPCVHPFRPVTECENTVEPMGCMERWSVRRVEKLVDDHWSRCWGNLVRPPRRTASVVRS